jgi:hypothetical protein
MTLLNSDGFIDVEKLEAVKAELKTIGHTAISEASLTCMRDELQTLKDDLPEDPSEWEECIRCGELDELNWYEHCPTCADDMGTSR